MTKCEKGWVYFTKEEILAMPGDRHPARSNPDWYHDPGMGIPIGLRADCPNCHQPNVLVLKHCNGGGTGTYC